MNFQNQCKQAVARAAIQYVPEFEIIGVGTGSTVNYFIEELAASKYQIKGAVASSEQTAARLHANGIDVFDLNQVARIFLYVDGADEITPQGFMIKGGGGALTREKIIASVAEKFICIVDDSKLVHKLGNFPLPIEVIPMAQAAVARQLVKLGGEPHLRFKEGKPWKTDNGCLIIDVIGLEISDPKALEMQINQIPGVVTVGLFAQRSADLCLLGSAEGVRTLTF